jgi:hypothetical protein
MPTEIQIEATQSSPAIIANAEKGTLEMRGDSYPENSFEFFAPVVGWIQSHLEDPSHKLVLELHLLYLNTSSVKVMMDIFDLLEESYGHGRTVAVNWYYEADNARIAELAEEFKEDCSFPFEIIPTEA